VIYQDLDREQPFVRIEDMAEHSIESVRKIQPSGPYYLGGHAVGGVVAFEMAQQLRRQGEKIALLALCECWAPQSRPTASKTPPTYRLLQKAGYYFHRARRFGPTQALAEIAGTLKKKGKRAVGLNQHVSLTPAEKEARAAVLEARARYVPEVYSGRIVVIRCSEPAAWRKQNPLDGWGRLAPDGVEMHEVPGGHATIYREPYVSMLAKTLSDVIRNAQAEMENDRAALITPNASLMDRRSVGDSRITRTANNNLRLDSRLASGTPPDR
jgi:thioesterase domain-containing protein